MKQNLILRWNALAKKDQRLLIVLALFIFCLFLYAYVWMPVQAGRARFEKEIPDKKEKLMLMRSQAAEIATLRSQQYTLKHKALGDVKATIEVSAQFHGLAPNYSEQGDNVNQLSLSLLNVSFDAWVKWVESLQSQHQVRLLSCHIAPISAGRIKVDAVFSAVD